MARLLSIKGSYITGPMRPSPYAYSLGIKALILPGVGQTGYECVSQKFGTLVSGTGQLRTSASGKTYYTDGSGSGGGQIHRVPQFAVGPLGYTLLIIGAAYSSGENALGRFVSTAGMNWYPFGSGNYTFSIIGTTGNSSYDYTSVLPQDGIERAVCFSVNPKPTLLTAPTPIVTVNGGVKTGTKTEFGSGDFVGIGPDIYVNNASSNARCLDGYTTLVAFFDKPHNLSTMRSISALPQILFNT